MSGHETEDPWAFTIHHSSRRTSGPLKRLVADARAEIDTLRGLSGRQLAARSISGASRLMIELADPLDNGFKPVALGAVAGFVMTGHMNPGETARHLAAVIPTIAIGDMRIVKILGDVMVDRVFDRIGQRLGRLAAVLTRNPPGPRP